MPRACQVLLGAAAPGASQSPGRERQCVGAFRGRGRRNEIGHCFAPKETCQATNIIPRSSTSWSFTCVSFASCGFVARYYSFSSALWQLSVIIITWVHLYSLRSGKSDATSRDTPRTSGLTEPDTESFLLQDGLILSPTHHTGVLPCLCAHYFCQLEEETRACLGVFFGHLKSLSANHGDVCAAI